ncbi:MAG: AAA family ATPase, partial [Pseudomonadota bacterium]
MSAAATGAADLRAELAALRKRAADTPALPEGPAAAAAAVLAFFDPFALPGLGEAGPDDPGLDAIMGLSEPVSDPPGFWTLGLHARRALLARLGSREAVRIALESVPDRPEVAAQLGFELIAQGPEAVRSALEGASLKRVAGLSIARTWVEGVAALEEGMPGADEIASALADLRRRAPLRELVGDHFTGRDSILSRMRAHLSPDAPSEVLFIHGPGGVGKSTVLAKFSLEIEESGVADAIVYLNLDRPLLRPGEPLTLLQDLLAQLAQQFGEHAGVLEEAAGRVAATAERFDRAFKAGSGLESMSVSGFWETMIGD